MQENERLSIGQCKAIGRQLFSTYKWKFLGYNFAAFAISMGISFVVTLVQMPLAFIPLLGILLSWLLQVCMSGVSFLLNGGLIHMGNKAFYGQRPSVDDIFYLFKHWRLGIKVVLAQFVVSIAIAIPLILIVMVSGGMFIFTGISSASDFYRNGFNYSGTVMLVMILVFIVALISGLFISCFNNIMLFSALRNPAIRFGELLNRGFSLGLKNIGRFFLLMLSFFGWWLLMIALWTVGLCIALFIAVGGNLAGVMLLILIFIVTIPLMLLLSIYILFCYTAFFNNIIDNHEVQNVQSYPSSDYGYTQGNTPNSGETPLNQNPAPPSYHDPANNEPSSNFNQDDKPNNTPDR